MGLIPKWYENYFKLKTSEQSAATKRNIYLNLSRASENTAATDLSPKEFLDWEKTDSFLALGGENSAAHCITFHTLPLKPHLPPFA